MIMQKKKHLNRYTTISKFDTFEEKASQKNNGKSEKMLVTIIYSFSHNVFYLLKDNFFILNAIQYVIYKCF